MASSPANDGEWTEFSAALREVQEFVREARRAPGERPLFCADPVLVDRFEEPAPLPQTPVPLASALGELLEVLRLGYCNASHPNYHAYFAAKPRLEAVLGDFLGEALNQTPAAWRAGPGATAIESEVLAWIADLVGYPRGGGFWPGGVVLGGGHLANLTALKLARDRVLGPDIQRLGLRDAPRVTVYMSREGHFSVPRALDTLGFGRASLRVIEVDACGRMCMSSLKAAIDSDRALGVVPLAVIGVAGTSGSGAVDPLAEIAEIAAAEGMWFHVDGAAGAAMARLPGSAEAFAGLAVADSLTLDPCKWLFVPYGIGVLLVRDADALRQAFPSSSHYWEDLDEPDLYTMGPYGSRQIRTLGLWLLFRRLGSEGLMDLLTGLRRRTAYLAARVEAAPELELLHTPTLAVCVFRARLPQATDEATNALNEQLQRRLLADGIAYVTLLDWRG
ncbi:MAG TPA: aspartate aminotransferase family protein, partial [Nannocystis exedens]|nr:aspartate aminotransferase family protein [Nannocystis exedens]